MKKIMKIGALCMAVSFGATAFSGCNTQKENKDAIPTLTWLVPGSAQPDVKQVLDEFNKISVEKIGAKLDIQFIDQGIFQDRMQLNMASKNDYDLCFVGYLNPYYDAVDKKGLYKLDELLETTPELKKTIDGYAWDAVTYSGGIYAVPNMQIHATSTGLFVQKKFIDKYNFDMSKVTKTTDIEPLLEQIQKNNPETYPFRTSWGLKAFSSRDVGGISNDDILQYSTGYMIIDENGEYKVHTIVEPECAEYQLKKARIMRNWFEKGYIRQDVASVMDDEQARITGKYGAWIDVYKPGVDAEFTNYTGVEVVAIPIDEPKISAASVIQTMIGIGANTKNPEKCIKMIELLNTNKDAYNLICYGIEQKHYNKIGENRIEPIVDSGYNPNASWKFGNQFNAYLLPLQSDDVWGKTIELNRAAQVTDLFAFTVNNDEFKPELARIKEVMDNYAGLSNGSENPDEVWDQYISDLKDAGLEKIGEKIQKQVDEFLTENKNTQ
ncbi:MAG: ABC transporter substrate-binding protein [Clostridia bacterium]|nr:ABC transporter substrate-binding protein [Clostridia bacterium]